MQEFSPICSNNYQPSSSSSTSSGAKLLSMPGRSDTVVSLFSEADMVVGSPGWTVLAEASSEGTSGLLVSDSPGDSVAVEPVPKLAVLVSSCSVVVKRGKNGLLGSIAGTGVLKCAFGVNSLLDFVTVASLGKVLLLFGDLLSDVTDVETSANGLVKTGSTVVASVG